MHLLLLTLSLLTLSLLTPVLCQAPPPGTPIIPNCPPRPASHPEQLGIFVNFVDLFYHKKDIPAAFAQHVAENYIQHNPNFLSGRDVAMNGLKGYIPTLDIRVAMTGFSNGTGWVMAKQVPKGKDAKKDYTVVVDVFRLDGSCVVEHWDVMQKRPGEMKNPLGMLDGLAM